MHSHEITHEVVAAATERFLAAGGEITLLPDTVEVQRRHLMFLMQLEAADELDGL